MTRRARLAWTLATGAVATALAAGALASPAQAREAAFERSWSPGPSPTGIDLNYVHGVVYVTDRDARRLSAWSTNGTHLRSWRSRPEQTPERVTVDLWTGNVYMTDRGERSSEVTPPRRDGRVEGFGWRSRPWELDHLGGFGVRPGEHGPARLAGIGNNAATPYGTMPHLYVADEWNGRILVYGGTGRREDDFRGEWGSRGTGDGQFGGLLPGLLDGTRAGSPRDVLVNDRTGHVYVADTLNHRIQVFTGTGSFLGKWGTRGTGDSQFNQPSGLAIDYRTRNIYVADTLNHRIQVFTAAGSFLGKWGARGSAEGRFDRPTDLAFDLQTRQAYVVDSGNRRVQRFRVGGVACARALRAEDGAVRLHGRATRAMSPAARGYRAAVREGERARARDRARLYFRARRAARTAARRYFAARRVIRAEC